MILQMSIIKIMFYLIEGNRQMGKNNFESYSMIFKINKIIQVYKFGQAHLVILLRSIACSAQFDDFMRYTTRACLVFLLTISFLSNSFASNKETAEGIEYPSWLIFINDKENDRFTVNCTEMKNGTGNIKCSFSQIMVSHDLNKIKNDEKELEDLRKKTAKEIQKQLDSQSIRKFCAEEVTKSKTRITDKEGQRILSHLKILCDNQSKDGLIRFKEARLAEEKQTCQIFDKTYSEEFKYSFESDRWISQSEPYGGCGFIDISYLEKDPREGFDKFSWNYISKRIITNKNGYILAGKCSQLTDDEIDLVSHGIGSLQYQHTKLMNCKYINLVEPI
jgi:hypothetical protein